ncbi:RusA family crossover junction endodeoxyribonuclease [Candidatus Peregrinibacteria bacterium]|nr:RusA family crossover junction endodeoxyribonuclease [Candidatus Peregrinibacteria bacterium]
MGKKDKKRKIVKFDFEIGILDIIPSTRLTRKDETESIKIFKNTLLGELKTFLNQNGDFPTQDPVFVYIQQYFNSKKEYDRRDIDNLSKTILDILKLHIFEDDSQVQT